MRHRKHHGSLGLVSGHRRALMANLASALLTHGRIETTEAKARAVRPYVEKLISLGKRGDLHARRQALAKLRHRPIVDLLFSDVAGAVADRNGGYTRMIKTGFRAGDAAPMAIVELVQEKVVARKKAKPAKKAAAKPAKKDEAKVEAKANEKDEEAAAADAPEAVAEPAAEAADKAEAKS
ncbi:MAG: 50S ribosomal protein L17 [Mariprofundaceae bacterium]